MKTKRNRRGRKGKKALAVFTPAVRVLPVEAARYLLRTTTRTLDYDERDSPIVLGTKSLCYQRFTICSCARMIK